MSTCISRHGEYSEHEPDEGQVCTRCFTLDADAVRAELRRARTSTPQSDETPTSSRPHRPTSTEPVDDQQRAHNRLRLIALAESHAHEADRLADNSRDAGTIHARLAQFWLDLAKEQRP